MAYLELGKGGIASAKVQGKYLWSEGPPWSRNTKLSDVQWKRQICPILWNLKTQKTTYICVVSPKWPSHHAP